MRRRTLVAGFAASAASLAPARAEIRRLATMAERAEELLSAAIVLRPEGDGPFPVALQMHGCGGCKPFQRTYAESLVEAGAAAVIIDSFTPRGIGAMEAYATVCTALQLRGAERAGDLYALYAWVRRQPWADPARIVAAGWSHGGWTVMDALALRSNDIEEATGLTDVPAEPLEGLAGAFLVYPYCGMVSLSDRRGWRFSPPTTAIVAGRDQIVGSQHPMAVLGRLNAGGGAIDVRLFPEATHSFDEPEAADLRVRYSPERAAEARALLRARVLNS